MPQKQAPKTAIVYCRTSSRKQRDAATIEMQVTECKKLVAKNGLKLVPYGPQKDGWIKDDGISGALLAGRGLAALIHDLEHGLIKIDYLVTYSMSRLARVDKSSASKAKRIQSRIDEARIYAVLDTAGTKILDQGGENDPGGLLTGLKRSVAEEQYQDIRRKTLDGKHERIRKGAYSQGGSIPWGYQRVLRNGVNRKDGLTLAPDEVNAPRLRQLMEWYVEGGSAHAARKAQAEGWLTPSAARGRENAAKEWGQSTVMEMVKNVRFYLGSRTLHVEDQAYDVEYPALITPALFAKIERARRERVLKKKTTLLSTGYVDCACGEHLHGHQGGTTVKRRYLRCINKCGGIREDIIIPKLWEAIVARLVQIKEAQAAAPKTADTLAARIAEAKAKVEAVQAKMDRVTDLLADGTIDKAAYIRQKERLLTEQAHAQAELDRVRHEREAIAKRRAGVEDVHARVQAILRRLKEGHVPLEGKRQVLKDLLQGERVIITFRSAKAQTIKLPAFGNLKPVEIRIDRDITTQIHGVSREVLDLYYQVEDAVEDVAL